MCLKQSIGWIVACLNQSSSLVEYLSFQPFLNNMYASMLGHHTQYVCLSKFNKWNTFLMHRASGLSWILNLSEGAIIIAAHKQTL